MAVSPSTSIVVGSSSNYIFTITNTFNRIPAFVSTSSGGRLEITFPAEMSLVSATTCSAFSSVTLSCSVNTSTRRLTITSASEIPRASTITVQIPNVRNPITGKPSSVYSVRSFNGAFNID